MLVSSIGYFFTKSNCTENSANNNLPQKTNLNEGFGQYDKNSYNKVKSQSFMELLVQKIKSLFSKDDSADRESSLSMIA